MPSHPHRARFACSLGALMLVAACQGPEKAPVKKLGGSAPAAPTSPKDDEEGPDRFRNPDLEPPPGREGEQLPDEALAAVLAEAEKLLAADDHRTAHRKLKDCANKLPASARCDLLMAQALEKRGRRRAEVRYYYEQVALNESPDVTAATYAAAGEGLRKRGDFETAAMAYRSALGREDTAELHVALSRVLQSIPEKRGEAADELAIAYEMAPDQHEYLYERATILGQIDHWTEAAAHFEDYLGKTKGADEKKDKAVEFRIDELRRMAKISPERDKSAPVEPSVPAGGEEPEPAE